MHVLYFIYRASLHFLFATTCYFMFYKCLSKQLIQMQALPCFPFPSLLRSSSPKCTLTVSTAPSVTTTTTLRSFRRATPYLPSRRLSYSDRSRSAPSAAVKHPVCSPEMTLSLCVITLAGVVIK